MKASAHAPWNGTAVRSRFFDAISLLLPAAERFLIETLEECRAQAGDALGPALLADVDRFLHEERAHQRVHLRYNDGLVAADPATQASVRQADRAADDLRSMDLPTRMALAAAFEVLTSVLSREVVERPYLLGNEASAEARIWRWHAREELAHCHVMVKAARAFGVGRGRRLAAYVLATGFLLFDVVRYWRALCACDVRAGASRMRLWLDGLSFAWRGVPSLLRMLAGWTRHLAG